jgi:arginine repressor
MGFMNKWDVSRLIRRLNLLKPRDDEEEDYGDTGRSSKKNVKRSATFITGFDDHLVKAEFPTDDIKHIFRW